MNCVPIQQTNKTGIADRQKQKIIKRNPLEFFAIQKLDQNVHQLRTTIRTIIGGAWVIESSDIQSNPNSSIHTYCNVAKFEFVLSHPENAQTSHLRAENTNSTSST